jgi:hypothetical protein
VLEQDEQPGRTTVNTHYMGVILVAALVTFGAVAIAIGLGAVGVQDLTAVRRLDLPYEGDEQAPRSAVYQLHPPYRGSDLVIVSSVWTHGTDVTYVYGAEMPGEGDLWFSTELQYGKVSGTADHAAALSDLGYVLVHGGVS